MPSRIDRSAPRMALRLSPAASLCGCSSAAMNASTAADESALYSGTAGTVERPMHGGAIGEGSEIAAPDPHPHLSSFRQFRPSGTHGHVAEAHDQRREIASEHGFVEYESRLCRTRKVETGAHTRHAEPPGFGKAMGTLRRVLRPEIMHPT